MTEITPLILALTDPSLCPNGALHNSILAGLVRIAGEWRGTIRVVWNVPFSDPVTGTELTLKNDTVLMWREKNIERADIEMVYAAWRLGAWDLVRWWQKPLGANADPYSPHHGLVSLFDPSDAYAVRTTPMGFRDQSTDAKALIEAAAQNGWISWKFRPTLRSARAGGRVAARDITLAIDGTRTLPFLYQHEPPVLGERLTIPLGQEKKVSSDKWVLSNQGATLRDARQRLGLSADSLANKLRLGSTGGRTVRRWEAGEVPISGPAQVAIELLISVQENAQ
jgi:DNA-binding transcriptional regulator YiaG